MKGLPVSEAVLIVFLAQPGRPGWYLPLSGYPGASCPANPVVWGTAQVRSRPPVRALVLGVPVCAASPGRR